MVINNTQTIVTHEGLQSASAPEFRVVLKNGKYYVSSITDQAIQNIIIDPSYSEDRQGEIDLGKARLTYWYDEKADLWHFIHLYESEREGEFAKKWSSKHITVSEGEIVGVETGEAPGAPSGLLTTLNVEAALLFSAAAIAAFLFYSAN